ncbi:osteomodulin-like [Limulus polyphemus]|uniref:Osteomodulin-like n=1 Tax=Limulus polyphemus TaxID=6850 RepID=A0ABM1SIA6_LIMPO|nr:osteomodulin-like [Limulus polyphemus]
MLRGSVLALLLLSAIANGQSVVQDHQDGNQPSDDCPNKDLIKPCSCSEELGKKHLKCSSIGSPLELRKVLNNLKTKQNTVAVMELSNTNFFSFPENALFQTQFNEMIFNNVTIVKAHFKDGKNIFMGLEHTLKIVNIFNSNISSGILWNALEPLEELIVLEISNAELNPLPALSEWLTTYQLGKLFLTSNSISEVDENAFSKFDKLSRLSLKDNNIKEIKASMFPTSLTFIDLSGNLLTTLPPDVFSGMQNLQEVKLVENNIQIIPYDVFTDYPKSLKTFDLSKNKLQCCAKWKWIMQMKDKMLGRCDTPSNLKNKNLKDVNEETLLAIECTKID